MMSEQNDKEQPQSRVKKRSNTLSFFAAMVAVILVIDLGFYFYLKKSSPTSGINIIEKENNPRDTQPQDPVARQLSAPATVSVDGYQDKGSFQTKAILPNPDPGNQHNLNNIQQADQFNPVASMKLSDKETTTQLHGYDPQKLIDEINAFYVHLDQQSYMQSFGLKESSKAHFSKLLQKLVNNPPVVIRETDDLFTLLKNTAHFFRVLGKDNINILKKILEREGNSFEKILNAYYVLTYQPEYLKSEYSLSIPAHSLTDYAGFFLNTMGGRLYLFRRDSTSRMVVSYYAIITIDRANNNGNGGHGIDLRPAILSLIDDIEIGGGRLQLKEEYLDTLYDLQEKYN